MPLAEQIDGLLSHLTADLAVWTDLGRRFDMGLFCGVFLDDDNRVLRLDKHVVQRLAERELAIGLDIYALFSDQDE